MTTPAKNSFNRNAPVTGGDAIVEYAAATGPLKSRMEKVMEAIDRNPDDFDAVISYGHPPLAVLGKIVSGAPVAGDIETARANALDHIKLYLGASKEVLRRFDEEYIPEAKAQFAESQDPEDKQYLRNVEKRREDFECRIIVLVGSRALAASTAKTTPKNPAGPKAG